MASTIDMTGQRFGKLTAIERVAHTTKSKSAHWLCRCDCGAEIVVSRGSLVRGYYKSCGCLDGKKVATPMKLQYIQNDPNWKQRKKYPFKTCPYNEEVRCNHVNCKRCGWNPKVAKARLEKIGYGN